MASVIQAGDPRFAAQFVRGFHEPEDSTWRWAQKSFEVKLRPPFSTLKDGGVLRLQFALPDAVLAKTGPVTLRAKAGTADLAPETYSAAGEHTYLQAVPANALSGDSVTVQFTADKGMTPGGADFRELSLIVMEVALDPKK